MYTILIIYLDNVHLWTDHHNNDGLYLSLEKVITIHLLNP